MTKIKLVTSTGIFPPAIQFAVQNAKVVDIKLLTWRICAPRAVLLGLLLAAGFVIGSLAPSLAVSKYEKYPD